MPARFIAQQAADFPGDRLGVRERHQDAAIVLQQFGGVPIGRRDHGFARAKRIGQCSRRNLGFVQIRGDVKIRRANELVEFLQLHETVVKDDVLLDLVIPGDGFQAEAGKLRPALRNSWGCVAPRTM